MVQSIRVWNKRIKNIGNAKTKKMRNQTQVGGGGPPSVLAMDAQKQVVVRGGDITEAKKKYEFQIIKYLLTVMPSHNNLVDLVVNNKSILLSCYDEIKIIMEKYFKDNCQPTKRNKWFMLKCIPKIIKHVINDCTDQNNPITVKLSIPIRKVYTDNHLVPVLDSDQLLSIIQIGILLNSIQIATADPSAVNQPSSLDQVVYDSKFHVICGEPSSINNYEIIIPEVKVHGEVITPAYLSKSLLQESPMSTPQSTPQSSPITNS